MPIRLGIFRFDISVARIILRHSLQVAFSQLANPMIEVRARYSHLTNRPLSVLNSRYMFRLSTSLHFKSKLVTIVDKIPRRRCKLRTWKGYVSRRYWLTYPIKRKGAATSRQGPIPRKLCFPNARYRNSPLRIKLHRQCGLPIWSTYRLDNKGPALPRRLQRTMRTGLGKERRP